MTGTEGKCFISDGEIQNWKNNNKKEYLFDCIHFTVHLQVKDFLLSMTDDRSKLYIYIYNRNRI